MGRRLNTYVHVDGVAYGPDDEIPAEVAEKITAPEVWEGSEQPKPAAAARKPAAKDPGSS